MLWAWSGVLWAWSGVLWARSGVGVVGVVGGSVMGVVRGRCCGRG